MVIANKCTAITTEKAVIRRGSQTAIEITYQDVKNKICPKATDAEIGMFLQMCQDEQLNPFTREIYLIKYKDTEPAQFVIAVESHLKVAENRVNYDGHEAGIVVRTQGKLTENRIGEILDKEETLLGGWAKVYLKDRPTRPVYCAVNLHEYQKYTGEGKLAGKWATAPAAQIRKVALVHALREAFPTRFANTKIDCEYHEIPAEGEIPEAFKIGEEENWKLFWAKQKEKGLNYQSILTILGINKMHEDWLDKGKTLEEADIAATTYLNHASAGKKEQLSLSASCDNPAAVPINQPPDDIIFPETDIQQVKEEKIEGPKLDLDWAWDRILELQKAKNPEVEPAKLKERFIKVYHLQAAVCTSAKNAMANLVDPYTGEFAEWLSRL